MVWFNEFRWRAAACLLALCLFAPRAHSQENSALHGTGGESEQSRLLRALQAEEKQGAYIFYTQTFIDKENQRASYRGSVYGAIKAAKLEGCLLTLDFTIVDKFSGVVGKKQTGDQEDTELYSLTFALTSETAHRLALVEAKPNQLSGATNSLCGEKPSCAFTWLAIQSAGQSIEERRVTNGLVDFDGRTDHILVPLSSPDSGRELIALFQGLAGARCNSSPASTNERRLTLRTGPALQWSRMPTAVRSHAKINLGLFIGAPRADGFHALTTVYQTLELFDRVTVTARQAKTTALRLTANDERVPVDSRNTAWKMVELALEALGLTAEVEIHIEKRLPIQGGLGAGSANAVAALVGLEAELGMRGDSRWQARRLELAAKVGSDVPLFLIGGAVLGVDRGQQVSPLPDFEPVWCVVATPEIGVSTPQAFRDWDALCAAEGLTAEASIDKLNELSRAYASAFREAIPQGGQGAGSSGVLSVGENLAGPDKSALVRTGISRWIRNDFERVVFPQHPSLAEIKRVLAGSGTPEASLHASLSGSGSALFGLYLTRNDAVAAQARLREIKVQARITRTLPRTSYWSQMLLKERD